MSTPAETIDALARELALIVGRGLPGDRRGLLERLSTYINDDEVDETIQRCRVLLRSLRSER